MINIKKEKYTQLVPKQQTANNNPTPTNITTVIEQIRPVLSQLGTKKDKDTQVMKEIILSTAGTVDDNGKITNEIIIKYLAPNANYPTMKKISKLKHFFCTTSTKLLHKKETWVTKYVKFLKIGSIHPLMCILVGNQLVHHH